MIVVSSKLKNIKNLKTVKKNSIKNIEYLKLS